MSHRESPWAHPEHRTLFPASRRADRASERLQSPQGHRDDRCSPEFVPSPDCPLCGAVRREGRGSQRPAQRPGDRGWQYLLGKSPGILSMWHFIVSSVKGWQASFQSNNLDVLLGINILRLFKAWKNGILVRYLVAKRRSRGRRPVCSGGRPPRGWRRRPAEGTLPLLGPGRSSKQRRLSRSSRGPWFLTPFQKREHQAQHLRCHRDEASRGLCSAYTAPRQPSLAPREDWPPHLHLATLHLASWVDT